MSTLSQLYTLADAATDLGTFAVYRNIIEHYNRVGHNRCLTDIHLEIEALNQDANLWLKQMLMDVVHVFKTKAK